MPSPEHDLRFLRAGIEQLEIYLLSTEIYHSIGISTLIGETPYPQLTLGNLLLAQKRVQAKVRSHSQKIELDHLSQRLEATRLHWRVAWEKKARVEFRSRLKLWRDFLIEYQDDPESNYDRYGYEVGRRVLLQLLSDETDDLPEEDREAISDLDKTLGAVFVTGRFIWGLELESGFPKTLFWYLYGDLKRTNI